MYSISEAPDRMCLGQAAYGDELAVRDPRELVLALLLLQDAMQSRPLRGGPGAAPLRFFVTRAGGFDLLLSLLNAHYNKTAAGRMPGWTFGVLRQRIGISARTLRTLIGDATDLGLCVQLCGQRDRRCKVYCVTKQVVDAWEVLYARLRSALPRIVAECSPGDVADLKFKSAAVPSEPSRIEHLPQAAWGSPSSPNASSRLKKEMSDLRNGPATPPNIACVV